MKRLLLMLLLALMVPLATKADVIEIGNAENANVFPFQTWTYGAWDEEIYPMSAFSGPCVINSISYNNLGIYGMMYPMAQMASSLRIYMGERESLTHASETDWTPLSELTLVYSHENVSLGAECGWEEIVLDDPFVYGLNGNLVVVVATAYDSPAWDVSMTSSSYADGNVSLVYSNQWEPGAIEFPSEGGALYSEFADIQFNVTPLNEVISIGNAENANVFPFQTWTYGAWDEEIYPMSAFSGPCAINAISYNNLGIYGMMYPMAQMASSLRIYMGERESLTHASETDWTPLSELTLVYSHENVSLGAECGWEEIVLDDPFVYGFNGNLVVVVATTYNSPAWDVSLTSSSYADGNVSLVYTSEWGPGAIEFPSEGGALYSEFADIQFSVSYAPVSVCHTPNNIVISEVAATSATITWAANEGADTWEVYISNGEAPSAETVPTATGITSTNYTFTGLNGLTNYTAYVRANCGDGNVSRWRSASFLTDPDLIGNGTAESPFLLYTKYDLEQLTTGMAAGFDTYGKHFRVMHDINEVTTPISGDFRGDFDGNNHTITLNMEGAGNLALFAMVGRDASIHDLIVDGFVNSSGGNAAGFVSYARGSWGVSINNCTNRATIICNSSYAGGFVANASMMGGIITNCINHGNILANGGCVGGIIGMSNSVDVNNCENRGEVAGESHVGGICGEMTNNAYIANCINRGKVTCSDRGGGIVGKHMGGIKNCFNTGELSFGTNSGGIVGDAFGRDNMENCYNAGMMTAANTTNCGALAGICNHDGEFQGNSGHSENDYNYYLEGVYPVAFGSDFNMTCTGHYSSFTQSGNSANWILSEPQLGTNDLLTALNTWRDGNESWLQWYADLYGNNNYLPTFKPGTVPGIEISPNPIVMAPRPIGAWMQGEKVSLTNTSQENLQISGVEFDNNYFIIDESAGHIDFPFALHAGRSQDVYIGTKSDVIVEPGTMTAQMSTIWNQIQVELVDIEVNNYTPVSPDVVELAEVVTSLPQTITQSTDVLYDNYKLPGDHPDAADAVYQLVFTEQSLFNAQVTLGSNAKLALYREDFNGKPGPMVDNYYGVTGLENSGEYTTSFGGDDPITNMLVVPGTYYLVVSSTSPQFVLELTTGDFPEPIAALPVTPVDGATDITAPLALQWQLGAFTAEYQLLMGTSNPPTEVLVDWTFDLEEIFTVDDLLNNRTYYWRVNERNAMGTTEGSVWHFTTMLNTPTELQANTSIVHAGHELLLHWTAPQRSLIGYNVYQDNVKINEALVTTTDYSVADLAYNMEGWSFTVTAVYDEGESAPSNAVVVRVCGTGTISGTVFEQDGVTGIAGATVTIIGYDEFRMRHSYICTTDNAGVYSEPVCSGNYIVFATKDGYQEKHTGSAVQVGNGSVTGEVNIMLHEQYYPVETVVAQYAPDSLDPQSPNVKIQWEGVDMPEPLVPGWHTYCEMGFSHGTYFPLTDHPLFGYQYPINVIALYAGTTLTKVALYSDVSGVIGGNYTCRIYLGGDIPVEGQMVSTITVDLPAGVGDWVEYELETPVSISGNETLWVIWEVNSHVSENPIPVCGNTLSYGSWANLDPDNYMGLGSDQWTDAWNLGAWMMKQYFTDRGSKAFQSYNVYRTNCDKDGSYTDENTVLLASGHTNTVYVDETWQTAEAGVYKWGVTRNYSGNREPLTRGESENYSLQGLKAYLFSNYGEGVVPDGWISYDPMHPLTTASLIDGSLRVCAGDFASDGYVHAYTDDHQLLTLDPGTGEIIISLDVATIMEDCAFDYSTNTMYGVSGNTLFTIDLATGVASPVNTINQLPMGRSIKALACSYGGQLYGIMDGMLLLCTINKNNGDAAFIGEPQGALAAQGMSACFDHGTGRLFFVSYHIYGKNGVIAMADLNSGHFTIMSDCLGGIQRALCIPYEYSPAPADPESNSVWSNCLDKDMWTTVEVSVKTNTGDSPEGTSVRFINTSEPGQGYDYMVTLDDSGYYSWDEFRKGTYNYTIEKDGYASCGNHESIEIWEPASLECLLEEIALQARNLYVSPTGWAQWEEGLGGDVLHYDSDVFGESVGTSGTPFYWAVKFTSQQLAGFNKVNSVSFYDAPDQAFNGKFMICTTDSPLGHVLYQKSITTTGSGQYLEYPLEQNVEFNNEESLWIVFYFESGADFPASASPDTGDPNGRWISLNGTQWEDVAGYGLNDTWKIRCHVKADGREEKQLEFYRVFLDGIFVENTTDTHFQHEVEGFEEGETHTTMVRAMYYSGVNEDATYTWTYTPCDNYVAPSDFEVEDLGDAAVLYWSVPENQVSGGEWSYYDDNYNTGAVGAGGASFYWGIMLPAGTWSGQYLGKVSVFDYDAFTGRILIYQGGETAPGTLVYSQQYLSKGSGRYVEYLINSLVELDESQNLWVVVNNVTSASYPAAHCDDMGDPNARWISTDGSEWHDITEFDLHGTWMIRAYTTDEMPVVYNILGTMVFRDGELLTETPLPRNVHSYADIQVDPGYHDYSIRLVYDNLPVYQGDYYAMSCPETNAVTVGVDENESGRVSVYPNPVEDEVTVKAADMTHIRIVNALGQMVYDNELKADETRIPMGNFGSGVYVIHITTANGTFAQRVVVCGK